MRIDFYGVKADPPSEDIAQAFGSNENIVRLNGGQGTSYRSGNIVLKPTDDHAHSKWVASIIFNIDNADGVRFAKPIKSIRGEWIYKGYVAWEYLEGSHQIGCYEDKIKASQKFHQLLKNVPYSKIFDTSSNSWSVANEVVWGKKHSEYGEEFNRLIDPVKLKLRPLNLPSQFIHGDLSGNFLFADKLFPAIIDFSPTWAINGFAEGVMLADVIAWESAELEAVRPFLKIPNIEQLAWRGVLRRIIEQAEHIKWFGKDEEQALEEARVFEKVISCFNQLF